MIRERLTQIRSDLVKLSVGLCDISNDELTEIQKTPTGAYVVRIATVLNRIIGLLVRVIDALP